MKNPLILLIAVLGIISAILLILISLSPAEAPMVLPHPTIPKINIGGDGSERMANIGLYAFLLQCAVLGQYICLIILSVSPRYRSNGFYLVVLGTFAAMVFVWIKTYYGHQAFLETGETEYFLGFPTATAWQTYGIWLAAIPLTLLYSIGFKKFIYTKEDEAAFEALLKENATGGEQ